MQMHPKYQFKSYIQGIFLFVMCASILGILGCGRGNSEPPPTNVYVQDSSAYTGRLIVKVMAGTNFAPVTGADVSIFATFQDYTNDIYLSRFLSNRNGEVDFGYLNLGNYYIYVFFKVNGVEYKRVEIAQIQATRTLQKNIILY
jgi:hypothetical protein